MYIHVIVRVTKDANVTPCYLLQKVQMHINSKAQNNISPFTIQITCTCFLKKLIPFFLARF